VQVHVAKVLHLTRCPYDEECGEVHLEIDGRAVGAEVRAWLADWEDITVGSNLPVHLRLEPWVDDRGALLLTEQTFNAFTQHDVCRSKVVGVVTRRVVDPACRHELVTLYVECGLPFELELDDYLPGSVDDIRVGTRISVEGVLCGFVANSVVSGSRL
jgi:hypothetical protein